MRSAASAGLAPSQAVVVPWREETIVDAAAWLQDIRDQYPLVGILQLGPDRWMAVWVSGGRGWQLDARDPVDLYAQLRSALSLRPVGP